MKEVVSYNPNWVADFQKASLEISNVFGDIAKAIHHIGSTSVPGIDAKPIIDILVEVSNIQSVDSLNSKMKWIGYECMGEYGITARRYFRRINNNNVRTHHVHVFDAQSKNVIRHLAFRDYLIAHPDKAQAYASLKKDLAEKVKNDWGSYVSGKDVFIKNTEQLALSWALKCE